MRRLSLTLIALVMLSACRGGGNQNRNVNTQPTPQLTPLDNRPPADSKIKLVSRAFQDGGLIPRGYTCDEANISPPLSWEGVPQGAKTLALIVDDPDAPSKTWVHWVVFNLPASMKEMPENIPWEQSVGGTGLQGTNDFGKQGYGGPCPPQSTHRYYFKLYVLDTDVKLDARATKEQLLKAMEGHVMAEGELMGRYARQ